MKKFLAMLLVLIMSFSLMACDIDAILDELMPPSSSYDDEDYDDEDYDEDDDEDDEEDDDEQSSSVDTSDIYGKDTTVYSNEITEDGKWVYGSYNLTAPSFSGYYNGYKSALTMTFDDGYDTGTGKYVNSIFEKYGFRGTMMLGPCFLNEGNIPTWNTILAEGYLDVGCHGYDHLNPVGLDPSKYEHEIKDAIEFLRTSFPGQKVLTFATPYAHIDSAYEEYLNDYAISNRLEADGGTIKVGEDYNLYRVESFSFKRDSNVEIFNSDIIGKKLDQGGTWVVELLHCVLDNPVNSTDTSKEKFSAHCKYIYDNYKDTVWVASFEDVSIYLKQVESAQVNYVACDRESMTINVTCPLDEEIYNYPMTIKLRIPGFATSAYAVIDGEEQILPVTRGSGVNTVIVKNVPVNGEDVKIYIGGNDRYANDCMHLWSSKRVPATCEEFGYMRYECAMCKVTFKNDFTEKLAHDFSNGRVTEKEPSLSEDGLEVETCAVCGTENEIVTSLKNLAPGAMLTVSEGKNDYVYASDIVDGSTDTKWVNGTDTPSVQLAFEKSDVHYVEIAFSKWTDGQSFIVSAYDGSEWTQLDSWTDGADTAGGDLITLKIDVNKQISIIKFEFTGSSSGCTNIHEITVIAKVDK